MGLAKRLLAELTPAERPPLVIPRVTGAGRAFLAVELMKAGLRPVLIADDEKDAEALYRDLAFLSGSQDDLAAAQGLLFLGDDAKSPYEEYSPDARSVMERIAALYRLSREPKDVRAVVVSPGALVRRQLPPAVWSNAVDYVVAGETVDRDHLLRNLTSRGYNSVKQVEDPGTFSVRGGIIDIFSPYLPKPYRLDLFGDEVESIRLFDPATQRTERELEDAILLPAREVFFGPKTSARVKAAVRVLADENNVPSRHLGSIEDDLEHEIFFFGIECLLPLFHTEALVPLDAYLPRGPETVYLVGDREPIEAQLAETEAHLEAAYHHAVAHHRLAVPPREHAADGVEILRAVISQSKLIELPELVVGPAEGHANSTLALQYEPTAGLRQEIIRAAKESADSDADTLAPLTRRLKKWRSEGLCTVVAASTRGQAERIKSLLEPKGLTVRLRTKPLDLAELETPEGRNDDRAAAGTLRDRSVHLWLVIGDISGGFVLPDGRMALISEEEIFGQRIKRERRRAAAAKSFISDLADLKPGDFVVHLDYGIGLYHGMTKLALSGVDADFLHVEYKGGDKLYLPVHRLRPLQKYAGADEGKKPTLSKLGTQTWAATKAKVKDTLLKMAAELLRLYAMRVHLEGYALPPPDERFTRFEAEFAFEPTPDQAKAIKDVIADLGKSQPMDRVICGDVGYGKTEVAMRGAMLTVFGGKQVAVLVPTTVLATQHFQVFSERLGAFGARVGIVSRFQTNEEIKKTLAQLKEGQIDVLVGTHRVLSQDVKWKDLGLLVIDEEHRFGVKHKEALKKLRAKVHVLTMSATPIPRTMHMGLMGVRDMSVIATPPVDRLAVKTEVHKFSEELIREAIVSELRRGGQCFVVHNRVSSIDAFRRFLDKLVPEARIVVGHGQMEEDRLEKVMVDFMSREYNVLLSTTIIESGIDIPNANTIVVNRADRMGLAQLYQLRGRVGRSKARGFAYLLIPSGNLTKDAKKRMAVIQRFTELGSGFKIATHDLEIRGAGNILGKEQSGSIAQVGFEVFQQLLAEAVDELKGAHTLSFREAEVQVPVPALIPESYVPPPGERLSFYQRFNKAESDEATYDLLQEIADLYGTPPPELENLATLMMVKQRLLRIGGKALDFAAETKNMPPRIVLRFDETSDQLIAPERIVAYVAKRPADRKMIPDGRLMLSLTPYEDIREILTQSKDMLDELILAKPRPK